MNLICPTCGTVGRPKTYTPGNMGTELLLWLLLILPGMLYSLWRHTARYKGCPTCAEPRMIPLDSPAGGQLQDRFGREGSGGD